MKREKKKKAQRRSFVGVLFICLFY